MEKLKIVPIRMSNLSAIQSILPEHVIDYIKSGMATVFVALEEQTPLATLCLYLDEELEILEILDIYTVEKHRRQGIAVYLLDTVLERYNVRMDDSLRGIVADFSESNQSAYGFFYALGFDIEKDTQSNKFIYTIGNIKNSFLMQKKYTISAEYDMIKYSDLSELNRRKMVNAIIERGGSYDMAFAADVDDELSISIWKNNQLVGVIEIIREANGEVCLGQFFALRIDTVILAVLQNVAETLFTGFSDDTKFTVYIISESSEKLIKKLLGEPQEMVSLLHAEYSLETFDGMLEDVIGEVSDGAGYEQAE